MTDTAHRPHSSLLGSIASSYGRDLKRWARGLATHYAAALALIVMGAIFLIVAAGVGISAGFYTLTIRYGAYVAYSIVGGSLFAARSIGPQSAGPVRPAGRSGCSSDH